MTITSTQFSIGQLVRHRHHALRGVVIDVDPEFSNSEEWWESIPEDQRPDRYKPFYHILAENDADACHAYISEQNLLTDDSGEPLQHPEVHEVFGEFLGNGYKLPNHFRN